MTDTSTPAREFRELPPLSLYVHLPWCARKCPYCDFNSHEHKGQIPERAYVDALLNDLAQELPDVWGRGLSSVFIGGGTPSLFSASALDDLLSGIRALLVLPPDIEVTLEANPGSVEQSRFSDYRHIGINRLSIGVQSFDDRALQALGRIHTGKEALRAVEIARAAGFENINLDVMFALPGQTLAASRADLQQALALQPEHLSAYELTLEPNTLFARFPPQLPTDEIRWQMHEQGIELLARHGFERYEVSAFAQTHKRCQHNTNYWLFGDYLGIGAGAHGKISFADSGRIVRRWKQKHPAAYLQSASTADRIGGEQIIALADTALEFLMNALRLIDGFPMPLFQTHTGVALDSWSEPISAALDTGLLVRSGLNLHASEAGLRLLNDVLVKFLPVTTGKTAQAVARYPVIPLRQDN